MEFCSLDIHPPEEPLRWAPQRAFSQHAPGWGDANRLSHADSPETRGIAISSQTAGLSIERRLGSQAVQDEIYVGIEIGI